MGVNKTKSGKYAATITYNGKRHYIGIFDDEKNAAKARDARAVELYGQFARVNFTEKDSRKRKDMSTIQQDEKDDDDDEPITKTIKCKKAKKE